MFGLTRSAISRRVWFSHHDWITASVIRSGISSLSTNVPSQRSTPAYLNVISQRSRQLCTQQRIRSVSKLLIDNTVNREVIDNTNREFIEKVKQWAKASKGQSEEAIATMLEAVLETAGHEGNITICKNGKLYITVLAHVEPVINSDYSKTIMRQYLKKQDYSALGDIYDHAVANKIDWLKDAVQEQAQIHIPRISHGAQLVTAYVYFKRGLLPKETGVQLEARTFGMLDSLNAKNIVKVLHLLALTRYRSVKMIGALLYTLHKQPALLSDRELANLFYTAAALYIVSPRMLSCLEIFSSTLLTGVHNLEVNHIVNMIISMGKMKWNNGALLIALCDRIGNPEELPAVAFANVLVTCSMIGVLPDSIKKAIVHQLKAASKDSTNVQRYLDVAWCLLVFNIVSEPICKDLLSEAHIAALTKEVPQHTAKANYGKLLNIVTASMVKFGMEMPKGLVGCAAMEPKVNFTAFHAELAEMLAECLQCDTAHLQTAVWYPTGNVIDFRYLYDTQKKEVVSPGKYKTPYDVEPGNKQEPTTTMKWVAIFGNMYQNMTIGLSGVNPPQDRWRLAETQTKQMGYHTVTISQAEFMADPDRHRKLDWLKGKISLDASDS